MSLKRYAVRRDKTEGPILAALKAVGAEYLLLDAIDVLVLFRGRLTLLECKSTRSKKQTMREKTASQRDLVARGWPLHFVTTPEQALLAIGALNPHTAASAALVAMDRGEP